MKKKINQLFVALCLVWSYQASAQTVISIPDCSDCAPAIEAFDCPSTSFNNTEFTTGEEFQASMMVPYTGGNGQPAGILSVPSTGVTGLTADLVGQTLMNGAGNLIFYVHGTPSGAGTASFEITYSGETCTVDLELVEQAGSAVVFNQANGSCDALPPKYGYYKGGSNGFGMVWVGQNGLVYGSGLNGYYGGMLGWPAGIRNVTTAAPVRALLKVTDEPMKMVTQLLDNDFQEAWYAAVSESGRLFVWGGDDNDFDARQPLLGQAQPTNTTPPLTEEENVEVIEIPVPSGATRWEFVELGLRLGNRALAMADNGEWYAWGKNAIEAPNSGSDPDAQRCMLFNESCDLVGWNEVPELVTRLDPKPLPDSEKMFMHRYALFYIAADSSVYQYGRHSEIGMPGTVSFLAPQQISIGGAKAKKIVAHPHPSISGEYYEPLVLTTDGEVWLIDHTGNASLYYNDPAQKFTDICVGRARGADYGLTEDGSVVSYGTIDLIPDGLVAFPPGVTFTKIMYSSSPASTNTTLILVDDKGGYWTYNIIGVGVTSSESFLSGRQNHVLSALQGAVEREFIYLTNTSKSNSPWPWVACTNNTYVPQNGVGAQ